MSSSSQGRGYWLGVVREFERSGLSHEAFCADRDLVVGTFRQWLYRLRREGLQAPPCFVEVVGQPARVSVCVVEYGDASVAFGELPDAAYLGALLRELADDDG
jgi:hypothetical protein